MEGVIIYEMVYLYMIKNQQMLLNWARGAYWSHNYQFTMSLLHISVFTVKVLNMCCTTFKKNLLFIV